MTQYPPIQVVDENDQPVGQASMDEIHKQGLIHRIVIVIVEDPAGRILLQKRSDKVSTNQNKWDASAAGHVDAGEDYLTAAKRELKEELGVEVDELKEVAYYHTNSMYQWRKLNRFRRAYKTVVPADTHFDFEPEEVTEVKWFERAELKRLYDKHPDDFVDDFFNVLQKVYPNENN